MSIVNKVFTYTDDVIRSITTKTDEILDSYKKLKSSSEGLQFATKPIGDTIELGSGTIVTTKPLKQIKEEVFSYIDDGIYAFDGDKIGTSLRTEMRDRILSQAGLNDSNLALKVMDNVDGKTSQLIEKSKYYNLGVAKFNKKTGQYIHLCENLKDMPDLNGLRGKTPLSNKGKGLNFRLQKIKESGIKTIIDLRSPGECSQAARQALKDLDLNYVNFPVEDCQWTVSNLDDITKYIQAVRNGDFYVGCANGQARTDLAVAISYVLNPEAKALPELYFGSVCSTRVSIKDNFNKILKTIEQKPDIVASWGWNNYDEFQKEASARLGKLLSSLSNNQ